MSYPPPRYHGDEGTSSAWLRPGDSPPDIIYPNGVKVDYLATGASTGRDFGLYRWTFGPEQSGPGPHFHKALSESFFVLTGVVQLYDGEKWIDAHPGDFLHVPPGGLHGFRNLTEEPASMLLHFSPGAPREDYFEGLLRLREGWQPGEDELAEFYREHDNFWT